MSTSVFGKRLIFVAATVRIGTSTDCWSLKIGVSYPSWISPVILDVQRHGREIAPDEKKKPVLAVSDASKSSLICGEFISLKFGEPCQLDTWAMHLEELRGCSSEHILTIGQWTSGLIPTVMLTTHYLLGLIDWGLFSAFHSHLTLKGANFYSPYGCLCQPIDWGYTWGIASGNVLVMLVRRKEEVSCGHHLNIVT